MGPVMTTRPFHRSFVLISIKRDLCGQNPLPTEPMERTGCSLRTLLPSDPGVPQTPVSRGSQRHSHSRAPFVIMLAIDCLSIGSPVSPPESKIDLRSGSTYNQQQHILPIGPLF